MVTDDPIGGSGVAGAAPSAAPPPPPTLTTINLVDPDLDANPDEVASRLAEGKREVEDQGGRPNERPYVPVGERPHDPDKARDETRQMITLWLIGLLCAIVVLTFVSLFARGATIGFSSSLFLDDLRKILDLLIGPVITLLASAVGFYFGSRQAETTKKPPGG